MAGLFARVGVLPVDREHVFSAPPAVTEVREEAVDQALPVAVVVVRRIPVDRVRVDAAEVDHFVTRGLPNEATAAFPLAGVLRPVALPLRTSNEASRGCSPTVTSGPPPFVSTFSTRAWAAGAAQATTSEATIDVRRASGHTRAARSQTSVRERGATTPLSAGCALEP